MKIAHHIKSKALIHCYCGTGKGGKAIKAEELIRRFKPSKWAALEIAGDYLMTNYLN